MPRSAHPWIPPAHAPPWRVPQVHRYAWVALATLAALPFMVFAHLLAGGILSMYIVAWYTERGLTTLWPTWLLYGGIAAQLLVPVSFGLAAWRLGRGGRPLWRWIPWLTWFAWPAWLLWVSVWFDVTRGAL